MYITNNRPGQQPFEGKKLRVVNRGGTTALVLGDVMALDLDASDTDGTVALKGVGGITLGTLEEALFHNIVDVAAAPLNALIGVVVNLLSGVGADDTEVEIQISGRVTCKVGGTNWSAARSSNGVALMADIAGSQIRRLILATEAANRGKVALILSNIATDLGSASATTEVLLNGWGSSVGPVSG